MRFYAHDGKSTHGPAGIEELLKLPGFDGDTLVCPVGSDDSADWKPALAYPPFKKALLSALAAPVEPPKTSALPPMPVIAPMTPPMPVPAPFPLPVSADLPKASQPAPVPPPPAPLPLPPAPKTVPCPRCAHANLEEAHFCNSCGARMDGRLEDISPPAPIDSPKANPPRHLPEPEPAPAFDPFTQLDPMLSYPTEPTPMSLPESPRRPLQPGKMGQLAEFEEAVPAVPAAPAPSYASASPSPAPELPPAAAPVPVWKRPAVLAAFVGAAVVASGLTFVTLSKKAPAVSVAELTPSAQTPMPEPAPAPIPAPPQPLYSTPPVTSSPAMPAPRSPAPKAKAKAPKLGGQVASAPSNASAKPKRARKPRPVRAPKPKPEASVAENDGGGETLIESTSPEPKPKAVKGKRAAKAAQNEKDPLLEALLTDATQPSAEAVTEPGAEAAVKPAGKAPPMIGQRAAAAPGQFSLPGLQRPVSASDRAVAPQARAPRPAAEDAAPPQAAGTDSPALAEPGKSPPPPGIEDQPAKSAEGDQLALVQVHEQFDFCAQLLSQGAYGDHYDTCLCKDTREAAPYRGRRGFYVSAKKKEAAAGHLETTAKILSSKIDSGVAKVSARWKSSAADKGRDSSQTWKLEDGLWCQAP